MTGMLRGVLLKESGAETRRRSSSRQVSLSPWAARARRVLLCLLLMVYVVLWIGGVAHHFLIGHTPPGQNWVASLFLMLAGLILLFETNWIADFLRLAGIALAGLTIEALGVQSGLPFGSYRYTDVLQPQLFGVPLVMGCAWMVLVAYLKQMSRCLSWHAWAKALLAALWMTAIDLVIDPLAANGLGYWRWAGTGAYYGIPASNFAGWFVMSFLLFALLRREWRANYWASLMGFSIVLFFTLIAIAHELFLAGGVGLMLCLAHIFVYGFPPRPAAKSL